MNSQIHNVGATDRLMSIDALCGFDMFWIIGGGAIVTSLGKASSYPLFGWMASQIGHPWDQFLPWDMIMPLFLFIVGVAMPFSLNKRLALGDSKRKVYFKIVWRTVILFVLGMVASGNLLDYDLSTLHLYYDTLQCIAVGYFFVVNGMNPITAYMASHHFSFREMGKVFVGGLAKWLGPYYDVVALVYDSSQFPSASEMRSRAS